jgi:hypothetical protein
LGTSIEEEIVPIEYIIKDSNDEDEGVIVVQQDSEDVVYTNPNIPGLATTTVHNYYSTKSSKGGGGQDVAGFEVSAKSAKAVTTIVETSAKSAKAVSAVETYAKSAKATIPNPEFVAAKSTKAGELSVVEEVVMVSSTKSAKIEDTGYVEEIIFVESSVDVDVGSDDDIDAVVTTTNTKSSKGGLGFEVTGNGSAKSGKSSVAVGEVSSSTKSSKGGYYVTGNGSAKSGKGGVSSVVAKSGKSDVSSVVEVSVRRCSTECICVPLLHCQFSALHHTHVYYHYSLHKILHDELHTSPLKTT